MSDPPERIRRRAARLAPPAEAALSLKGADLGMLRRLVPYARPHLALFVGALITMPLASGAALMQPLLIKDAIDAALVSRSREVLLSAVWIFLAVILIEFCARFAQVYLMQLAGQRSLARLRLHIFDRIQRLHVSYFDRTPVGRIVTRVTNDVDALGELFASGAVTAVADLLTLAGIVGLMLYLDVKLSLVAFCALPPLALGVELLRRRAREAFRTIRVRIAQLNTYLAEQVQGLSVVQAFGREAACAAEYEEINASYRAANHRAIRYDALLYSIVESVSAVTVALVLWYAGVRVGALPDDASTAAWVGTVVALYEYIQRFFVPIRDLAQKYTIVQSSLAAAERIFGLLDVKDEDAPAGVSVDPQVEPPPTGVLLALEDVVFGYRPDQVVLDHVTLRVRRGEKVALVGATGAGKTTVTSLLLRLHDVREGGVFVGGEDVRTVDARSLRRRFSVVAQDAFFFEGTVLENVAVGDPEPDRDRAEAVLRRSAAWTCLERRNGGLDTRIEERGANFSAGERQLLAMARALYLDRDVLLLDEATASVDSETEGVLQAAIEEVLEDRTALIIAHRLSTIRRADRIVVFHKGRIAEEGRHEALLARGGIYARLHRLSLEREQAA